MVNLKTISRKRFEKFLISKGCCLVRKKGDHLVYSRPGLSRPIIIQADTTIPIFIIKSNLRTLNISSHEFLKQIQKIK